MSLRMRLVAPAILAATLCVPFASAQTLKITPAIVDSSEPVERALKENDGRATTALEGKGGMLELTYSASEELQVYMVPVDANGNFSPTDFLRFTLPATELGDAEIDLTVSPGWSESTEKWILNLLTKNQNVEAGFLRADFIPVSRFGLLRAAFNQFLAEEPYSPSSYHALHGYRILGAALPPLLALLLIVGVLIAAFVSRSGTKLRGVLTVLVIGLLAYQARFSLDLLRFTGEHLTGYAAGNYDEAGSVYLLSDVLREAVRSGGGKEDETTVYVCREGTNYKEKILRYRTYPMKVSALPEDAANANFAVVTDKREWTLSTATEEGVSIQTLSCGDLRSPAVKLATFPDGSILFSLRKS